MIGAIIIIVFLLLMIVFIVIGVEMENKKKKRQVNKVFENSKIKVTMSGNIKSQPARNFSNQHIIDRHAQIINESVKIIETSKNLDTIESRKKDVLDNWNSASRYGTPSDSSFIRNFEADFNNNVVRAVRQNFEDFKTKILALKTSKSIDNNTTKMFEIIEKARQMLLHNTTYSSALAALDTVHLDMEEFYSNLTSK